MVAKRRRKLASHAVAGVSPDSCLRPEGTPDFRRPFGTVSASHEPKPPVVDFQWFTQLWFMAGEQVSKEQGAFHEPECHLTPALSPINGGEGVHSGRQLVRQRQEPASVHGPKVHPILAVAASHDQPGTSCRANGPRRSATPAITVAGTSQSGWWLILFLVPVLLASVVARAQMAPVPAAAQAMLQIRQPSVDLGTPVTVRAYFDPPLVRPGDRTFYRVEVTANESAIEWPATLPAPPELKCTAEARGQLTSYTGNTFRPLTTFLYEMEPATAGQFLVTNFSITCDGKTVAVPSASLVVVSEELASPPPRQLELAATTTNLYIGQPFHVRVRLPAGPQNQIEALREIKVNGPGLMTDENAVRQSIEIVNDGGQLRPAFIGEMTVTPIETGPQTNFAQGYTAGREFNGPISIHGQVSLPGGPPTYVFLISDPIPLNVRPLPTKGELPGFTGAMGFFNRDAPQLSTNRLRIGEPVHLQLTFHGAGDLTRLVPPAAPVSRDWQVIADPPPAIGFTLIPLTDEAQTTPPIPFCSFDPATGKYCDLSTPALPVTVTGEGLPAELRDTDQAGNTVASLKLSGPASVPGKSVSSLTPLQLRGWFVGVQLLPVAGFGLLWQWDRRRRYLEAHPEIVRRRRARRELRRKRAELERAVAARDPGAFVQLAAAAMRIAVAPHYPANPQALVGRDVLAQLDADAQQGRTGATVKQLFAAADRQFAAGAEGPADWLILKNDVAAVLTQLEENL